MQNPYNPPDTGTVKRASFVGIAVAVIFVILLLRILKFQTLD